MDLSVLIVSYNSREMLRLCLESLKEFGRDVSIEIIVVDNSSKDGSVKMVRELFPDVTVKANDRNLGFSGAVNQAFELSSGDFVFLMNPDARLRSAIFTGMLKFWDEYEDAGVLAPRIEYPDQTLHVSARRFITLLGAIMDLFQIHLYLPDNPVAKRFVYNNWPHNQVSKVDWVTGAVIMMRRTVFRDCGMLDHRFFMYFEDMDLCMSVKKAGYGVYFSPEFTVIHDHAKGGSHTLPVRRVDYFISLNQYLYKHKGFLAGTFFRLCMILWGGVYLLIRVIRYFFRKGHSSFMDQIDAPLRLIFKRSFKD